MAELPSIERRDDITNVFAGSAAPPGRRRRCAIDLIDGMPGLIASSDSGLQTMALGTDGAAIAAIHVVRNPDKRARFGVPSSGREH